jgi:hypothetical protein
MSNIHELEEALYAAWNTVDDIGLLKEEVQGAEAREAVDAVYWLLDARMNKVLNTLEAYHANERGEGDIADIVEDYRTMEQDFQAAISKVELDKIVEIMHPTPATYRSIYEDEGALSWKPYRTGQINTHLNGNFRTVVDK